MRVKLLALALLLNLAVISVAQEFNHAELFKGATPTSKKGDSVKGSLKFDKEKKQIEFVDQQGAPELSINHETIKSMLYERAAKPRYAEGILIAWPLLFTKSKKHYPDHSVQRSARRKSGEATTLRTCTALFTRNFRRADT